MFIKKKNFINDPSSPPVMYIQQKGPHRDLKKIKPDEEGWVCSDTYRLSYSMDQTTNAHIVLEILPYKSNMIKALVEEGLINNEEVR